MEHRFADCILDDTRLTLVRGAAPVGVEPRVFDLILCLVRHPGKLVSREQLIEEVWQGRIISESAISACVAAARKAVGDTGKAQAVIRTVARRGLMFVADVETSHGDKSDPTPLSAPAPRIRYVIGASGQRLNVAVHGGGPPLLRVDPPGWDIETEMTSPHWREATDLLAQTYRLARFTQHDFGRGADGMPKIDYQVMADDIALVADAVGFDRFTLLAQSGGVHASLRFAARYPDQIERLVIVGGYVEGRSRRSGTDVSEDVLRRLISENWRSEMEEVGAGFMLPYLPEGPLAALVDAARNYQSSITKEIELALRDAINAVDNSSALPRVRCPTLIVHARDDAVHPLLEARRLAKGIAEAELLVLDTANHLPLPCRPEWTVFHSALDDFMNSKP
ncbi:MAG: hypothetical protein EP341_09900 [Sphingomonadales bacterium]|nr:MAG: hypothetical protein EP341_09900 [Sphingomonadales bacterium]